MLRIEKIVKKGRNVRLFLSDERDVILTKDIILKYQVRVGDEISEVRLKSIKVESDSQRARSYIDYLLAARSYSTGLLNVKLEQKGFDRSVIKPILLDYMNRGLLDNRKFARQLVESMLRNRPAGRRYIIARLQQKYVPRKLAGDVVDDLFSDIDESDLALRVLRKRWSYFSKFELDIARRKAYNYLSRRAINYRAAQQAFDMMVKEEAKD